MVTESTSGVATIYIGYQTLLRWTLFRQMWVTVRVFLSVLHTGQFTLFL